MTLAHIQTLSPRAKERPATTRPTIEVPSDHLRAVMMNMRGMGFDLLLTHTVIDRVEEKEFELFYLLMNVFEQTEVWISTRISRIDAEVESVSGIWPIAEFHEREVYDLFGVLYRGHPDLRRIFLEEDWVGFPLRKDYVDDFMLDKPMVEKLAK